MRLRVAIAPCALDGLAPAERSLPYEGICRKRLRALELLRRLRAATRSLTGPWMAFLISGSRSFRDADTFALDSA
jgi:hypothetical protein